MFNEHQASLDDRFVGHEPSFERLLSVHRSELDTTLDEHRATLEGHSGELDARLQELSGMHYGDHPALLNMFNQHKSDIDGQLDEHTAKLDSRCDDLLGRLGKIFVAHCANHSDTPSFPVRRESSAAGGRRLCATASPGPAHAPLEFEQVVKQVKVLRASRGPEAWHTYCREQGKESFDPARHKVTFLEDFLRQQGDSAALAAARRSGRPLRLSPARPAPDRS